MNLRKFLLMFIICVSSFMIYTNNVKANVIPGYKHFTDNYITCSTGYGTCTDTLNIFTNLNVSGEITGQVTFNFVSDPQIIVNQVLLYNNNGTAFPCQLGSQTIYADNTTGYNLFTAVCPMNIDRNGIPRIRFYYDDQYYNGNSFKFYMGDWYSFYRDMNTTDYTTILNNINSNISSLNTALGGKLDNQTTIITNIYNQITNTNTKLEDIKSKLDSLNSASTNISNNTEQIKNDIKDSSIDNNNANSSANTWASKNASNNTITQLLTLPISLLTNITNAINTSCSSYSLGSLFGTDIILPCINLSDYIGSALVSVIDILFSGFMIFNISKKLIKIFNDFTNLKSNQID